MYSPPQQQPLSTNLPPSSNDGKQGPNMMPQQQQPYYYQPPPPPPMNPNQQFRPQQPPPMMPPYKKPEDNTSSIQNDSNRINDGLSNHMSNLSLNNETSTTKYNEQNNSINNSNNQIPNYQNYSNNFGNNAPTQSSTTNSQPNMSPPQQQKISSSGDAIQSSLQQPPPPSNMPPMPQRFPNQNSNVPPSQQQPISSPNYGYNNNNPQIPSSPPQNNWNQQTQQNFKLPPPPTTSQASSTTSNYNSVYDQQNGNLQNNYPQGPQQHQQQQQNVYQQNSYQAPPQPPVGPPPQMGQHPMTQNQYNPGMTNFNTGRYGVGTPGQHSGFGGGYGGPAAPQQNKLDPEAMPSVVQVIMEDKNKYESSNNVLFMTTIPASVPPLVTTITENDNQLIQDGGCASPLFVRPTIYQIPVTEENLKISDIPFGMVVKPFDDQEVERKIYVPVTPSEIVRCNRCKAYMNPYNRFIDGGRRFQCSMCHHLTEVPQTYFANLDHIGRRLDKLQRPELYLGSYEFMATEEYCRNNVNNNRRPHLIFACELTETSKPILNILSKNLINIIKNFPRDPLIPESLPPMFGFVTYNSKIQIYDILNNGHAHVICDLSTPFSPLNTFLIDPLVHMDKIESFLSNLPKLYANEELDMQTILGPVIEASLMATQVDVANWINKNIVNKIINDNNQNQTYETIPVGKIYLFHCTLPTYGSEETPGRLKQRWTNSIDEIRKLLGTDKEKTILCPDNKYYIQLGQKCVTDYATGVELFLFPPANGSFLDIATLGELTRLTGTGAIYKFFNDFSDTFLIDLKYSLNSSFAFDCVIKVRTSTGIRPTDYIGYHYSRSPNDVECAAINTNTNICIEFKYDDKLTEDEHIVIQTAILYTSLSGQRRVRIHNIALATCQQIGDVYRNACCDTVVNVLARNAVNHLRNGEKTIQQTKEAIVNRVINILTAYRKHCAQPGTSLGQLILPEALKILPMYICGLLKCDAIDGGPEMSPDDKAYAQLRMLGAFISLSQVFLYPRLYKIVYENDTEDTLKYSQIRCSAYKLTASALAYVLENGFYLLFLLTSNGCNNVKFLNGLFGPNVDSATKIPMDQPLPNLLTNESQFINQLFKKIENERKCSYKVFIIRQGIDKIESVFRSFLYEDQKTVTRMAGDSKLEGLSYVDLLCHLHKEIRAQMN